MIDTTGRHPATVAITRWFDVHLAEPMHTVALYSHHLAEAMLRELPDDPELVAGLRKLLEARDCFIRAALAGQDPP